MKQILAVLLFIVWWIAPLSIAHAMVTLSYAPNQSIAIPVMADVTGKGAQGPLTPSHGNVKIRCPISNSGNEVTIDEAGAGFAFLWLGGAARVTFNPVLQSIGSTVGEVCYIWWEGSGAGSGAFAGNLTAVQFGVPPPAATTCDIIEATSGTSFTIASCTSAIGESITLASGMFEGALIEAYTNGASACNVASQRVLIQDQTAGVVTVFAQLNAATPISGFTATPSTINCGIRF